MADANFASLSPTLLARKGGAKPAMRPQHALMAAMPGGSQNLAANSDKLEDLGWNDMGDESHASPVEPIHLTPSPHNPEADAESEANDRETAETLAEKRRPAILFQQDEIARRVAGNDVDAPVAKPANRPVASKRPARGASLKQSKRAAFTLRLDQERHIKLRLATTIRDCSAQQLVTEALDALIAEMPELETLAAQVKRR
ncbi:hypothetical protein [Tsuneonella mangrovi]|uniref:hypothetical protein n=1 Tax=Tsuneonella mangrovi TaxID=1982042 RepID=UPI000BA294F2|nr:hypothetical protein [Tsuneonella mangrovi]